MSHTIKIQVQLRDKNALGQGVLDLQGVILGEGRHSLYQGSEQGFGFTLPRWTYPLVLKECGQLAFDDYSGHWGNRGDVERLIERYSIHAAKAAAEAQGWLTELGDDQLVIYHPDGGTLAVKANGTLDAVNFVGAGCASASEVIESALGTRQEQQLKSEYFAERTHVCEMT